MLETEARAKLDHRLGPGEDPRGMACVLNKQVRRSAARLQPHIRPGQGADRVSEDRVDVTAIYQNQEGPPVGDP